MLQSRTTFIVGAGASHELGLPTGAQLKIKIAELLNIHFADGYHRSSGDAQVLEALQQHARRGDGRPGDVKPLLHKCWKIAEVIPFGALSIDNYLDAHSGDIDLDLCGKLGIVRAILQAESDSKLIGQAQRGGHREPFRMADAAGTWLIPLMNLLTEGVHARDAYRLFDRVSFVVFNYDRCLEHFMTRILTDYYGMQEAEAQEVVGGVRIFHPYGQVGFLPWQQQPGPAVVYGQTGQVPLLEVAAQLKTFTEKVEEGEQLAALREAVRSAQHLVFLGFAYHQQNLTLLSPHLPCDTARIFGSAFGMSGSDIAVTSERLTTLVQKADSPGFKPELLGGATCVGLFDNYRLSLAS